MHWVRKKPTMPGWFLTRITASSRPWLVEVYRHDRALFVRLNGYADRMSGIGKHELEWLEIPNE